ncbi:MAG: hypothetical protein IAF02_14660 [Anaerolineae bacterium]|nr:hypothetical protein [Anaerolineae bacterium]
MRLIAAKVNAALRMRGDTIPDESIAEMDEMAQQDMVGALTKMMLDGDAASEIESLEDVFARMNEEMRQDNAVVGDFDINEIYNDLGDEPERDDAITAVFVPEDDDAITAVFKTAKIIPTRQGVIAVPKGEEPAERYVFGVGMVKVSELDKYLTPKPTPFKPEHLTTSRSALIPKRLAAEPVVENTPDEPVVDNTPDEAPANKMESRRLVFGAAINYAKTKRKAKEQPQAQLSLF